MNEDLLVWVLITVSTSLSISQASNHVFGRCILIGALVASSRPLLKLSLKEESNKPSVQITN
jgi:hypothetical protein